eukprot:scaffold20556_cov73-Phaeocystis_antarctica.AAC.1
MSLAEALEKIRQGCTELNLRCACSALPTPRHRRPRARAEERAAHRPSARRTRSPRPRHVRPACAAANDSGDEGAKELAAALKTNTTLTKLDLSCACSGAPSHHPRHRRMRARAGGVRRAARAFAARARRAHRACAPACRR